MNRATPVVLRNNNNQLELLAFKHPNGRSQLVKGKLKKGESLEAACVRELEEESGIKAQAVRQLGVWDSHFKKQVWGFCLMHYDGSQSDNWDHETEDDGGHIFSFFWQPLNAPLNDSWNEVYTNAFQYIKKVLEK